MWRSRPEQSWLANQIRLESDPRAVIIRYAPKIVH